MAQIYLDTRIKSKIDTISNWVANGSFVPLEGELIVYSDGATITETVDGVTKAYNVPKFKVGDGSTPISQLKYVDSSLEAQLLAHINDTSAHITDAERVKWNSKLDAEVTSGELIFSNEYSIGG